jgi:hypothetical protein
MFCNFYLAKNHKISNNLTTTETREKRNTDLKILEIFDLHFAKFENSQIFLNKISHRFRVKIKLLSGRNNLIEVQVNITGSDFLTN